jgi:CRP-like cAMP-binding protein
MQRSLEIVHLFKGLSREDRAKVEAACTWRSFVAGQMILNFQDHGREVLFLVSGEARSIIYAASGRVVAFGDLTAGTMFGEIGAIDGKPRVVAVEARTACTVAVLDHESFLRFASTLTNFTLALLQQVAANIRMLTARVFEFSTLSVNNRIRAELLRLVDQRPTGANTPIIITPTPKHSELAARVSTQREAVTRELNNLARLGVLKRDGRSLVISDVDRLRKMVAEAAG